MRPPRSASAGHEYRSNFIVSAFRLFSLSRFHPAGSLSLLISRARFLLSPRNNKGQCRQSGEERVRGRGRENFLQGQRSIHFYTPQSQCQRPIDRGYIISRRAYSGNDQASVYVGLILRDASSDPRPGRDYLPTDRTMELLLGSTTRSRRLHQSSVGPR